MKYFFIYILAIPILFLQACGPTKKIVNEALAPKMVDSLFQHNDTAQARLLKDSTLQKMSNHYIDFKTFSAKVKVETQDKKGKNPDITAVVRMVKDSAIWVSLTATFLNVEVYRAYITPDSVILLNKRDKTVQYRSLSFLQEVTHIPFDFKTLQNMLIGNPVFFDGANAEFKIFQNVILASATDHFFKNLTTLSADEAVLQSTKLDDVNTDRNRTAYIQYEGYQNIDSFYFSTIRKITISEINKLDIQLEFKQMEFNKELSVYFNVPKSYTEN